MENMSSSHNKILFRKKKKVKKMQNQNYTEFEIQIFDFLIHFYDTFFFYFIERPRF